MANHSMQQKNFGGFHGRTRAWIFVISLLLAVCGLVANAYGEIRLSYLLIGLGVFLSFGFVVGITRKRRDK